MLTESSPFESIKQVDVPFGREGKYKRIVAHLLSDIDQLESGRALKVPITDMPVQRRRSDQPYTAQRAIAHSPLPAAISPEMATILPIAIIRDCEK